MTDPGQIDGARKIRLDADALLRKLEAAGPDDFGGAASEIAPILKGVLKAVDRNESDRDYWQRAAIWMADVHAANGYDAQSPRMSKSRRQRLRGIMVSCLQLMRGDSSCIRGFSMRYETTASVEERLDEQIKAIPEA